MFRGVRERLLCARSQSAPVRRHVAIMTRLESPTTGTRMCLALLWLTQTAFQAPKENIR